ncbi:hypothetical protein RvY_16543 [Ramazzottius varieornatus]|uniref:Uncharacterized protein n=1 Tax=Ramazzottius varieornatus TaxID=947166 RepID=A0A1D1VYV0_RAMVA|nr:hypothetical protein RvY_16543 [Ramazzottius varieornatus]
MGANDEMHGDISERIFIWMTTGTKIVGKVVGSLLDEDGEYSKKITSGKVATSDEKARENLGITARKSIGGLK